MTLQRGDVVLAWFPFSSGAGGKRRPCLVIQNDIDNTRLTNTVVVQITSNLRAAALPTHLLVEIATVEGRQTGLLHPSAVSCNNIATIEQSLIDRIIGSFSSSMMDRIDACLKAALQIV